MPNTQLKAYEHLGKALRFADESKGLVRFGRNVCLSWGFAQSLNRPALFFPIAVVAQGLLSMLRAERIERFSGRRGSFPDHACRFVSCLLLIFCDRVSR